MHTYELLISMSANARLSYSEVIEVPADLDWMDLNELVEKRFNHAVNNKLFTADKLVFAQAECTHSEAPAGAVPTFEYDGRDVVALDSNRNPILPQAGAVDSNLIREAMAVLSLSHPGLAAEVEKLLLTSHVPPTIVISRDSTGEIHTLADKPVRVAFMDGASELGEYKSAILDDCIEPGGHFKKCLHDVQVTDIGFALAPFGFTAQAVHLINTISNPGSINGLVYVGNDETIQAMIAALHYWKVQGMCEPTERSDELQQLATRDDELTSASEEDIDALIATLNNMLSPQAFHRLMGNALAGINPTYPVVVVEVDGGMIRCIRTSEPADIVTIDYDTEGLDEDRVSTFGDEEANVSFAKFRGITEVGTDGVSPLFCFETRDFAVGLVED